MSKLRAPAAAAFEVFSDLALRRYPAFVTGGPLPQGQVPVFCFHSLEPESFGRKLDYLGRNGYVTLSADEYFDVLQGRRAAPARAVVLTFDDGRSSVRTIGAPLLRRHGFKGIVFVVPGRTRSRPGPLPPTLDDVPAHASVAELLAREQGTDAFLSWEEMLAMQASGLFDFASHSLSHARVHVAPEVEDFLHPAMLDGYGPLDVPWVRSGSRELLAHEAPLGTPLLRSRPRLSEQARFIEEPEGARAACVARVAAEGGARFFEARDWRARLRRELAEHPLRGRWETPEERLADQRRELVESRQLIEARLGRPAPDLCYPWHVSGPSAERLAREAGYRSAYCGKVAGVPITLPGGDPQRIARVGEDYVELLPGAGRGRLTEVLREKFTRRFGALRS